MTESKAFDPTKPVQTKDGRRATIVDPDYNGRLLTVVTSECGKKGWRIHHQQTGRCLFVTGDRCDLVNVPERDTVWVNRYRCRSATVHMTRQSADAYAKIRGKRTSCTEVDCVEGEGLSE